LKRSNLIEFKLTERGDNFSHSSIKGEETRPEEILKIKPVEMHCKSCKVDICPM
jgi:hypothetical protein